MFINAADTEADVNKKLGPWFFVFLVVLMAIIVVPFAILDAQANKAEEQYKATMSLLASQQGPDVKIISGTERFLDNNVGTAQVNFSGSYRQCTFPQYQSMVCASGS